MLAMSSLVTLVKCLIFSSVTFVWVVRYQNIIEEFKQFGYPTWLRDIVGIIKLTCVVLIMNSDDQLIHIGALGISLMMIAALITHIRIKNPVFKMIPSFVLFNLSTFVFLS
jgi:hypothetical protein